MTDRLTDRWTDGRSVGRTDKAETICSPFGEHKKLLIPVISMLGFDVLEGCLRKALCNEALYSHELNSASSRIQTWDLVIQNRECQSLSHPDTFYIGYMNISDHPMPKFTTKNKNRNLAFNPLLTFTSLWANLADNKLMALFFFFPENRL